MGVQPRSSALAGGFLTPGPAGKSLVHFLILPVYLPLVKTYAPKVDILISFGQGCIPVLGTW